MAEFHVVGRSLVGASQETVRSWVADYLRQSRLDIPVGEMVQAALQVEGTHRGVTKTKVRRARRLVLGS